jgi:hypothetical protein
MTTCDVWWNNAVMLKEKRWCRYQTTNILSDYRVLRRARYWEEWGCSGTESMQGKGKWRRR